MLFLRLDNYVAPVVFPTEPIGAGSQPDAVDKSAPPNDPVRITELLTVDPLYEMTFINSSCVFKSERKAPIPRR